MCRVTQISLEKCLGQMLMKIVLVYLIVVIMFVQSANIKTSGIKNTKNRKEVSKNEYDTETD